jgi:class 3 adenylate cyclase/tetratricopeptide (TPR) repeat protein
MTFDEILAQLIDLLRRDGRVSYRALKRRFNLDEEYLEDLKAELIEAKQLAVDEGGKVLVWSGTPVTASAPAREPVPEPLAYTPKHLAEKILTSRSALEGERKQVTVLFCDIADSSGLAQQLDLEVMHQIMDQVLRLMAEAVHRYEGTVNQYLGDGLMALFGAPVALEDHAFRAVQAALTIHETISGYSAQLHHDHGVQVRLRLGLNTGLVVVGRIGDDLRMDYTAVGNTTHLAARMQAIAEPGTILITEATHRLVEGHIYSESLGQIEVKGQRQPVVTYKVTGRRPWRSRLEISAERGLTGLVGRHRELGLLHDCLVRAEAGRGQVIGIVGEPGVGKSRLLYEFRRSLDPKRVTWIGGHCMAHGQATPYLSLREILRMNFRIEEGDNPLQIWEKLRQGVHQLDPTLEWILPFLGALFALPGADDTIKHVDPKDRRQKTFEAIRALAVAGSQRRPHVIVVENLHWIDQSSEDFYVFLAESLAGMHLLLLTTHRPGYSVRWADKTYYTQISLDLFTEQESEAMVANLLGSHDIPPDLLRIILEKAGGNPLFIEEVSSSLLELGIVVPSHSGIRWAGDTRVEFPATMQDLIRARIDRLEQPVKRTVQTAAVIGREFGVRLLAKVSDIAVEIQHYLHTLKHVELIHEKRFFPELEYIFKHAVIQDVAYQSLLVQRRKELHGAIGQAIEDLYADRLEEHATILAYHYARSERQDKAVTYALRAGDQAARLYANAEATTYYEQALTLARALPISAETQRLQIDAALKLAAVGMTRQDIERDRQNLEQAHTLAEALHDEPRLAQVLYWLGRLRYVLGDLQTAIAFARQSLTIADRLSDDALAAPPVNLMGRIYWQLSDFAQAGQMMERSVGQMHRLGNTSEEATAAGIAGVILGFMGEFGRALPYADRGLHLTQATHNPFAEAAAYFYRGAIREQRGEWSQAIADYDEAQRIAAGARDLFRVFIVQFWAGRVHALAGNPERGRLLLEEGLALAEQIGTRFMLGWQKVNLAICLLALGQLEAVLSLAREAIHLAAETGDRYIVALAHRTLAEALLRLDPADAQTTEGAMLEAIRIQQEISANPELARSYLSYARLLHGQGAQEKVRAYLTQAINMFQQMGMAWDLAQAQQLSRVL